MPRTRKPTLSARIKAVRSVIADNLAAEDHPQPTGDRRFFACHSPTAERAAALVEMLTVAFGRLPFGGVEVLAPPVMAADGRWRVVVEIARSA